MKKSDQGYNAHRFHVIVRTLIFIFHNGRVLLLQGAPDKKIWAGKFNGIGGHLEKGEDILSSARRELREETGLSNIELNLRGNILIDSGNQAGILLFVFRGDAQSDEVVSSTEGQLKWIGMDELENIDLVEDLRDLIPRVFAEDEGLFSGYYYFVDDKLHMNFESL